MHGYRVRDKIGPFFKGLVYGRPFREVATEGLRRELPEEMKAKYAKRIIRWGTTDEIYRILKAGCAEDVQSILTRGFVKRFYDRICFLSFQARDKDPIGIMFLDAKVHAYDNQVRRQARELLESGKITSEEAKGNISELNLGSWSMEMQRLMAVI
ncbi:hypothetical protein KKB44_05645 [Candidatus Micrarchaeota archaeon]|nr:hypothetical protein [Candidatus Micrarchaeota archaeon]